MDMDRNHNPGHVFQSLSGNALFERRDSWIYLRLWYQRFQHIYSQKVEEELDALGFLF